MTGPGAAAAAVEPSPLLRVVDVERVFDVSPPWLNRVLER